MHCVQNEHHTVTAMRFALPPPPSSIIINHHRSSSSSSSSLSGWSFSSFSSSTSSSRCHHQHHRYHGLTIVTTIITSHHITSHHMGHHITSHRTTRHDTAPHHTTPQHATPHHTIASHAIEVHVFFRFSQRRLCAESHWHSETEAVKVFLWNSELCTKLLGAHLTVERRHFSNCNPVQQQSPSDNNYNNVYHNTCTHMLT